MNSGETVWSTSTSLHLYGCEADDLSFKPTPINGWKLHRQTQNRHGCFTRGRVYEACTTHDVSSHHWRHWLWKLWLQRVVRTPLTDSSILSRHTVHFGSSVSSITGRLAPWGHGGKKTEGKREIRDRKARGPLDQMSIVPPLILWPLLFLHRPAGTLHPL